MAMKIIDGCIVCGACEPECPNTAIAAGDPLYLIDPAKCTECIPVQETPKCIDVCPVSDCIAPDPDHREDRPQLEARYARLH